MEKKEFLQNFMDQLNELPASKWHDFSDSWGSSNQCLVLSAYNLSDNFNLHGLDRHEAFDLVYKNRKFFTTEIRHRIDLTYDCTGEIFESSTKIKKLGNLLIFFRHASYDI